MDKKDFNIWLKEHNNKISIKQLHEILTEEKVGEGICWKDENGNIVLIGYVPTDDEDYEFTVKELDSVVEPQISTKEQINKMHEFLDTQHYEPYVDYDGFLSGKKWYDKFYEHKGRKYRR